jgi:hypothetical protein
MIEASREELVETRLDELFDRVAHGGGAGRKELIMALTELEMLAAAIDGYLREKIGEALSWAKVAVDETTEGEDSLHAVENLKSSLYKAWSAAAQLRDRRETNRTH